MPNAHGQVTNEDFLAPPGQFRLIMEDARIGEFKILADYHDRSFATNSLKQMQGEYDKLVFTLYDETDVVEM